jgi:hypothetical protein
MEELKEYDKHTMQRANEIEDLEEFQELIEDILDSKVFQIYVRQLILKGFIKGDNLKATVDEYFAQMVTKRNVEQNIEQINLHIQSKF